MSGHVCGQQCWYIAKRRGQMVRGRNRCTGAWEPHWWREDVYPYLPERAQQP